MPNLDNKVQLPELTSRRLNLNTHEKTYSKVLMLAFCLFVVVVLVVGIFVNSYFDDIIYTPGGSVATPNLENAAWKVKSVAPATADSYTLELKSSIGNLRTYEGVRSYGISATGKFMAMTSNRGLEVVNLADNSAQAINTPFDITGDLGEIISWSYNDDYFAIPVYNVTDSMAHLLIFSQNGTSVKDYDTNIAYKRESEKITMYPALFSPKENYVLVRSFNDTDSSTSIVSNKAVILTAVNIEGKSVWETDARNSSTDTELIYNWSADGKYVYSAVIANGAVINYANQNLFTKVLFEID